MAESIARREARDVMVPASAGIYPLGRVAQLTLDTLLANGYSVDDLSSKPLRLEAIEEAKLLVNLSGTPLDPWLDAVSDSSAGGPSRPSVENWDVADPYGEDTTTYQRILEEIESRVRSLAARLRSVQPSAND